ncbi:hypothetical protein BDR03DRAFT_1016164 [Suillus americanus]|nr:hypothetical protein BDR03DRAFT_1016164 [Suillus americanus]
MSLWSEDDDSDRVLESSYGGSIHKDHNDSDIDIATPSPIEEKTRAEFHKMCRTIYKGQFCLITRDNEALEVAHVIPVATEGRRLKLYEYCLGLDHKSLHLNSQSNLFNLCPNFHTRFDTNFWFLLPDAITLGDIHHDVKAAIEWRQNPNSIGIMPLRLKWQLGTMTKYTFISISCKRPITRIEKGQTIVYERPYSNFPLLECHIPPHSMGSFVAFMRNRQRSSRN